MDTHPQGYDKAMELVSSGATVQRALKAARCEVTGSLLDALYEAEAQCAAGLEQALYLLAKGGDVQAAKWWSDRVGKVAVSAPRRAEDYAE